MKLKIQYRDIQTLGLTNRPLRKRRDSDQNVVT